MKVVLDTNVILKTISRKSTFSILLDKLYQGSFDLYISNDIQLEYEEKISDIFSKEATSAYILGNKASGIIFFTCEQKTSRYSAIYDKHTQKKRLKNDYYNNVNFII